MTQVIPPEYIDALKKNLLKSVSLNNLSLEETYDDVDYTDYRFEVARLNSFLTWRVPSVDPAKLAAAGFYYIGETDKVRCFECRVEICQWTPDDDPMVDHQRWSDKCRFIRKIPCGNVPINVDPDTVPPAEKKPSNFYEQYGLQYCPNAVPDGKSYIETRDVPDAIEPGTVLQGPKYPEYATYTSRICSFGSWPSTLTQTKEEMAAAGFFFMGLNDQTICYFCGGGLKDWTPNDNAVDQHKYWFPGCRYILEMQGNSGKNVNLLSPNNDYNSM